MLSVAVLGVLLLLPRERLKRVDARLLMGMIYLPLLGAIPGLLKPSFVVVAFQSVLIWSTLFFITVQWRRHIGVLDTPKIAAAPVERAREKSVASFRNGDLEEARSVAMEALGGPVDLEEGRQLRAWLAYLEIAAGRPGRAAALAEAAIGPQVMAGEEWLAYCRTLHAWALWEQGFLREAAAVACTYYANCPNAGEIRESLGILAAYLQETQETQETVEARSGIRAEGEHSPIGLFSSSATSDAFRAGLQSRRLAQVQEYTLAREAAQQAEVRANTSYSHARALLDHGCTLSLLGNPSGARERLRSALELWPTLPAAMVALAAAEEALGAAETARALRNEARRRFPEHEAALEAGTTGLPA